MAKLAGQVALISGGSRGQGAAEARLFAEEGACVVIGDILDDEGRALARQIGASAFYCHLDVTSEESWRSAMDQVAARYGHLDILVNNAGIIHRSPLTDLTVEEYTRVFSINQLGVFLGMKTAVPLMKKAGGSIVNISSTAGLRGLANHIAYVGTKYAVRGMTKTAAIELAPFGIRVNSVHPGLIDTPMIHNERGAEYIDRRGRELLLGRSGTVDDVAKLVLFLACKDSAFSTGSEFTCDGGSTTASP